MADTPNKEDGLDPLLVEATEFVMTDPVLKVYSSRQPSHFMRLIEKMLDFYKSRENPLKEDLKVVGGVDESMLRESPEDEELDILFNKTINAKQIAVTTAASSEDLFSSEEVVEASNKLLDRYRVEFKSAIKARDQRIAFEARKPLEEILDEQGWNRCDECNDFLPINDECLCENCDAMFHEGCAGYTYDGDGEYPSESAYAICKKCFNEHPLKSQKEE